ncbi:putative reverse transcriptase domain-containing protein [Tanacetum coccineum]
MASSSGSVGYKTTYEYGLPPKDRQSDYHTRIKCAPFEALYGRKCRSPVIWTEVGESQLIDPDVQVPLEEVEINKNLRFVERPNAIVERDVKKLKRRRILLVKVRWNSRQGVEYTWERKDQFRKKYLHLFSEPTFLNGKPHSFNGTKGVVDLRRWIEKVEQVFEICKCAEEDKVMFAASTFEGRALTWWNGNVHTLGLVNTNHIPWTEFKTMMTMEYCPATKIQRMEQELWTLTLKGDDIESYNNRFHELALMCPELVPTEKKKIERYVRGFPERIKGNITSSKPTTLHDAINMARELVKQAVQGRAARIGESNKRKWEDHQRNTNNNNRNNNNNNRNNYHQQQNRRQETARAYAAAPTEGRGYVRNLTRCNRCNSHHNGQCPPKCQKCLRTGHQEKDCIVRVPGARVTPFRM